MRIVEIDDKLVEKNYVSNTMKYRINKNYWIEEIYDSIQEAVDSLGMYFSPILLPNNEIYYR